MTQCNQLSFGFGTVGRRKVVGRFDGGHTLFADGHATWYRGQDMGPDGQGLDWWIGNWDYFNNGARSWFWGE